MIGRSDSTGLILAILVDRKELSLRELVLCFVSCKAFRELLDGRGFCIGTAWLCACLENGRSPAHILSRLRSARESVAYERPLSRVDQVTSFLMRYEDYRAHWELEWAQLLYQEPDGGVLCEGVKKMRWLLKRRLVKELHKSTGYYPGLCTLKEHLDAVTSVAWSPCGNFVASGSWDNTIKIWHAKTGSEKCSLTGHSDWVRSVAWSPDGKLVASGSDDKSIRIWDVATGKEAMGPLKGHDCPVLSVAFWHSGEVCSVAWSPDGKTVASGRSDKTIRLWDVETGTEKCSLRGHSGEVYSVAWSPCGNFVASGSSDQTIKIWHTETGSEKRSLTGHSRPVYSVAWSPDGRLVASGSYDETIRIWDVATGKEAMGPLTGHSGTVYSVAWSPDGRLVASGSYDETIRIWDVATGKEAMGPLTGHSGAVYSVAWSPDGKTVASGSSDSTVWLWDVETGSEKCSLKGTVASWRNLDPRTKELAAKVKQGGDSNRMGQYIATAHGNMVYVYVTNADGEERDGEEPLACFRSPAMVLSVSCMGTSVVVGCRGGQVLFLEAPLLSA